MSNVITVQVKSKEEILNILAKNYIQDSEGCYNHKNNDCKMSFNNDMFEFCGNTYETEEEDNLEYNTYRLKDENHGCWTFILPWINLIERFKHQTDLDIMKEVSIQKRAISLSTPETPQNCITKEMDNMQILEVIKHSFITSFGEGVYFKYYYGSGSNRLNIRVPLINKIRVVINVPGLLDLSGGWVISCLESYVHKLSPNCPYEKEAYAKIVLCLAMLTGDLGYKTDAVSTINRRRAL